MALNLVVLAMSPSQDKQSGLLKRVSQSETLGLLATCTGRPLALRRNVPAKKPFWDRPSPKKKSTPFTSAQKAAAKARAKKAGRPYPNLVDNAAVRRKKK